MTALFTPMGIGGVEIRNRVVMPAMVTRLADDEGHVTDATVAYFRARAAGGTGLIVTEMASPERVGRHRARELGIYDDRFLPGLTRLVKELQACGSKVAIQIGHAGGHTREDICGEPPIAPSAVPHTVFDVTGKTIIPIAMTKERIAQCVLAFVAAAQRARAAGFDCIELHAANGYLLSQFLCPEENRRDDEYGGSLANRARISLEILARIKRELPDFPVIFRLGADDLFPTGLQFTEALEVAKWAALGGADAIHVTAGHYRSLPSEQIKSPPMAYPEGVFLGYAARIKAEVRVPVIAVGRLGNPALAMAAVDSGRADFVALGRSLIADPEWVAKVQRGVPVRRCLACNACSSEMRSGGHVGCLVNPIAAHEIEFGSAFRTPKGERICVIGAGPAGLSYASLVAPGNDVTVFERDSGPGGAFRYAGKAPRFQEVEANQESLDAYISELERACKQNGVKFRYGIDVARSAVNLRGYDRIVIASGARYRYGLGMLIPSLLNSGWGKSGILRRFLSIERWRKWFYYGARQGTGEALRKLGLPRQKVIVIGDAARAGTGTEAITSAFRAAYSPECSVSVRAAALRCAGAACVVALLGAVAGGTAWAQAYPARAVRVIVPFAPGGGTDNLTRILAPRVGEILGQQLLVDNRPGASGQIGTELAARAAPDGYTILHVDTSFTSNPSLLAKLPYDPARDFAPISLLASAPVVLIIHPSVPVRTLKEMIALARARPGQLNFATGGTGSATHLGVELFKAAAKIDLVHIPYKGSGPAAVAVLSGQVVMMFAGPSSVKPHVAAGKLRALAITGEKRNAALPEVPTFVESGLKGVDSGTYWSSLAPAATPRDIIQALSGAMARALQMPDVRQRLVDLAFEPIGSTPEESAANIRSEIAKWARVVKAAGIRVD